MPETGTKNFQKIRNACHDWLSKNIDAFTSVSDKSLEEINILKKELKGTVWGGDESIYIFEKLSGFNIIVYMEHYEDFNTQYKKTIGYHCIRGLSVQSDSPRISIVWRKESQYDCILKYPIDQSLMTSFCEKYINNKLGPDNLPNNYLNDIYTIENELNKNDIKKWYIRRIHKDPCKWNTGKTGVQNIRMECQNYILKTPNI